jgi:hypothetical protein
LGNFFPRYKLCNNVVKNGWATFWATFSQTHPVALVSTYPDPVYVQQAAAARVHFEKVCKAIPDKKTIVGSDQKNVLDEPLAPRCPTYLRPFSSIGGRLCGRRTPTSVLMRRNAFKTFPVQSTFLKSLRKTNLSRW